MKGEWLRKPTGNTSVIFVHGILSSVSSAFKGKGSASWPDLVRDDARFNDLGIYLFDYYTGVFSGTYKLSDAVDMLKEHLRCDGLYKADRLIFVCHSMGGIVVRKFIVDRQLDLLSHNVKLALFLVASPSLGSEYANFAVKLAKFLHNSQLEALRFSQDNLWLTDLDINFRNLYQRQFKFPPEPITLNICGKELIEDKFIALKRWLFFEQVVPPFAGSTYFGEAVRIPTSDHLSIAKPDGPNAFQHKLLCQFIVDQSDVPGRKAVEAQPDDACVVKVISDPTDPDLLLALHLYEDRIPEEERFESSDIVRWLREDQENRKSKPSAPRDYFLVEKCDGKVQGCALLHYYPALKFAFFAYLVADRGVNADPKYISHKLIKGLSDLLDTDQELKNCESILFEVDDPRAGSSDVERRERMARLRLFSTLAESMNCRLAVVDFFYNQPCTSVPDNDHGYREVQMVLGEVTPRSKLTQQSTTLTKAQMQDRLKFIYLSLYPEGFSDRQEDNEQYRRYLERLFKEEASKIADHTRLLTAREFRQAI